MGLNLEYIGGQTPLDEDETEGLLIDSITTRQELDEFEQLNIQEAVVWTISKKFKREYLLSEKFIRDLHVKMFSKTWSWAGEFRKSNKNLGVDKYQISTSLRQLIDDCKFWIEQEIYPADEIAIRFKHRLVSIHCFPNGNGRHSRLMADVLAIQAFKQPYFTWGRYELVSKSETRGDYLSSLKKADLGNIEALLEFARS